LSLNVKSARKQFDMTTKYGNVEYLNNLVVLNKCVCLFYDEKKRISCKTSVYWRFPLRIAENRSHQVISIQDLTPLASQTIVTKNQFTLATRE